MRAHILSASDCMQILEQKCGTQNFKILSTSIAPLSDDVNGFMGEHLRAKFVILLHGKETVVQFFMKQQPADNESAVNQFAIETGAYIKEAFMYEHIIGKQSKVSWAPQFYLFKDNTILVLDDASADGFVLPVLGLEQFDLDHCKRLLSTLAAFHAHCFELEHRKSVEIGRPYFFNEEFPDKFVDVLFSESGAMSKQWIKTSMTALEHLIDVIPENNFLSREAFKVELRNLCALAYEAVKPSKVFPNVICHADLWFKNMLFRYVDGRPEQCLLIDFQMLRYSVPASDIAMFLQMNTSRAFRKQHTQTLLRFYHNQLGNELQQREMHVDEVLPWVDFDASLPVQMRIFKLIALTYKTCLLMGDEFLMKTVNDIELYRNFMFLKREESLLHEYNTNPVSRSRFIDLMTELRETLQEPNISREDCYRILQKKLTGGEFELEEFSTTPASSQLIGYLGEHKILNMSVLHNGEQKHLTFFTKFPPSAPDRLAFVTHSGGFAKEIFLYETLFEKMEEMGVTKMAEVHPSHYLTRKNSCLIFENLREQNYKPLDKYQKLKYDEVSTVIGSLAKFHAASLIFEEKMSAKTGNTFRIGDKYAKYVTEPYYVGHEDKYWDILMQRWKNGLIFEVESLLDPSVVDLGEMRQKITAVCDKFATYVQPSAKCRNVITHGELWANNIMILRDDSGKPIRSIFVDFQTCRYTAPANDLMSFLYFNTTQSFRDQYERKILERYHSLLCDELLSEGLDAHVIVPLVDFVESCEFNRLFAAAQTAMFHQFILLSDEYFTAKLNDSGRQAEIDADPLFTIKENCKIDERYRKCLTESITTLCNVCKTLDC